MYFPNSRALQVLTIAAGLVFGAPMAAAQDSGSRHRVDLELVLAVDASSSVSTDEFNLQIQGLAEAFRDPRVLQAIRASGDLGVAVSLFQWSDSRKQILAVDWTLVTDADQAVAFADEVSDTPRFLIGGSTAIGGALKFAIRLLVDNDYNGRRRVIDLSGDGRANQGARPAPLRDAAVDLGITINGLAILNEDPVVADYYRSNVIGGTGAFIMTANDYESYALAILIKLIREIAGAPIARAPPGAPPGAPDGLAEGRADGPSDG